MQTKFMLFMLLELLWNKIIFNSTEKLESDFNWTRSSPLVKANNEIAMFYITPLG